MMRASTFDGARAAGWLGGVLSLVITILCFQMALSYHAQEMYTALKPTIDSWGYYQYLPACIGTHRFTELPWAHWLENGNHLDLFTIGVALLQAPFFLLGCALAWITGAPMDGYSEPFAIAIMLGTAVYLGIGCNLLYHALRRSFGAWPAAISVAAIVFCTNLWFYSAHDFGMSHAYSFFLCAMLVYLTLRMRQEPTAARLFGLLLVSAWIVLVRQPNGMVVLFPLCYGARSFAQVRARFRWLLHFRKATLLGVAAAFAIWLPQLLYWHLVTGEWVTYTYGHKDEHFDWAHPQFAGVLFSPRNGWFLYTPLMLPVMYALLWMAWRKIDGARTVLLIWALVWWCYASWWCWFLGGAFGYRGFIEHYAFLSIPLAWCVQSVWSRGWPARIPLLALLCLLGFVNFQLTGIFEWKWSSDHWTANELWNLVGSLF